MPRCSLRFFAAVCSILVFSSCMFFPKEDPSQRFADISVEHTESIEDILNDLKLDDEQIFAVSVTREASVSPGTAANLFGVYPTYILIKVRPADANTSTVTIYRRLNAESEPELIVDHESAARTIFEDYNEEAKAFQTYEYQTVITLKNGTEVPSEWQSGYGAVTPERFFFIMNDEVGSSHKKFPDFGKPKAATNNASGNISGSAQYKVQIKGLGGGTAYITYDNYCDYRLHLTGCSNTDSDMGGNGDMYGTLVASGMYHGSCNYDDIDVRSKNAAGGTYLVQTAGVSKRLAYDIQDKTPSRVNVISLTVSTNTEALEGEVPNSLGVYPITLTWDVAEDRIEGSTLQILRRTMDETAGTVIYSAPASAGSSLVDTFEGTLQQPQTFYQYQALLYKGGMVQSKTRWETGTGYLEPMTLTVTATQGTAIEGYEPNIYGIYPVAVQFSATSDSSLLTDATCTLVRRLKGDDATRTVLYSGANTFGELVDVNQDAMFGQEFEYRLEITNTAGLLVRSSDWAVGYGDRLPLDMTFSVSDNGENLAAFTPNRFGAYPVSLQYAVTSVDASLTDLQFTILRRNEDSGVEETLLTEAVATSTGTYTDTTADACRLQNRRWAYAVELKSGSILMSRTDWVTVEPVLVPAELQFTASDNRDDFNVEADRFGVTPVTVRWNWESDVPFVDAGSYVKLYYKLPDDLNGTLIAGAPNGLSGSYQLPATTEAYQYKAELVTPNGKKTAVVATTDWTDAVSPYLIPFGFDYLSVSNNEGNVTLEPNRYGINPFTVSWKWSSEKPFLKEGSYVTLIRRDADRKETVLLSKRDRCRDTEKAFEDLISDARRDGYRTFSWKVDLYTAEDELLSSSGWSDVTTSWIVPVNFRLTTSQGKLMGAETKANSSGIYPIVLQCQMNDCYYSRARIRFYRRQKNAEGYITEVFDSQNKAVPAVIVDTTLTDATPDQKFQYQAEIYDLEGKRISQTDWIDAWGAMDAQTMFTLADREIQSAYEAVDGLWEYCHALSGKKYPIKFSGVSGSGEYITDTGILSWTRAHLTFKKYTKYGTVIDGDGIHVKGEAKLPGKNGDGYGKISAILGNHTAVICFDNIKLVNGAFTDGYYTMYFTTQPDVIYQFGWDGNLITER